MIQSKNIRLSQSEININLGSRVGAGNPPKEGKNILLQRYDQYIPQKTNCPTCGKGTSSIHRKVPGELTWMWCSFATIITLCFLPFFIESCNNVEIFCAECLELKDEKKSDCCNC